ncbi:hypothetical protein N9P82_01085 [bacterium]|nr:hypothetical protein [bacterium]
MHCECTQDVDVEHWSSWYISEQCWYSRKVGCEASLIVEGRTELSKVLTEVSVAAVVVLLRAGGQM